MNKPLSKEINDNLIYLEMAGQGHINGSVIEWQQLKLACEWAAGEIRELKEVNAKLKATIKFLEKQ